MVSPLDTEVTLQASYGQFTASGDIGVVTSGGGNPASVRQDIESALGIGDDNALPYVRAQLDVGTLVLTASYFSFSEQGTGTLSQNFGTIPAATSVNSDLDMTNIKASLTFDIPIGPVTLAPGIAVDYFDMTMLVSDTSLIVSETIDLDAPVPLAYLRAEADLVFFGAYAEAGYFTVSSSDLDGSLLDLEIGAELRPLPGLHFVAGYRNIAIDVEGTSNSDDYDADLTIEGWFIGGGIRF